MSEKQLPSELISSTEAFKRSYCEITGTSYSDLNNLRVIAVYRTVANAYMAAVFLYEKYCIFFVDEYRIAHEVLTSVIASNDISAKLQVARIAHIIGATLIEEANP